MALQPSFSRSCFSSFSLRFTYDVFLSFRGTDTRYGFTGNLHKALSDKGIRAFIDDRDLQSGEEITPSLVMAIQESRIAIIVLSTNYAASSFCLDELVHIMECVKGKGRLVLPVFYDVAPSHVRHQRETYAEAFGKHEERFKDDKGKVEKWRKALRQVADLSGYHFKHGVRYEHKFIGRIVEAVSRKIRRVALPIADYPVGLDSQLQHVTSLLDFGSNGGANMVGIHGIGGVGKTTLALAIYNSIIADHFEGTCFLANVRENSNKYGLVHLQSILLFQLIGEKEIRLTSVQEGKSRIQYRLQKKKVLLILDDVEELEQLQAIAGKPDWFAPGSRVIITTRDKHLLECHGVERTYEVEGLNNEDARELLIWKAFKSDIVSSSYMHVLSRAITYACGLPLALEVIGSNLFGRNIEDWESALDQYERIPNKKIQNILKVSFDALEEEWKSVFLDIACCFKGYDLAKVEDILHAHHGGSMKFHVGVLVEKSLVKIDWEGRVTLHDLIEDMGKEIIRQESPKEPGKRSRLWYQEDIIRVLEHNEGSNEIEIIHMDFSFSKQEEEEKVVEWNGKAFRKMKNLKTLIIKNARFSACPKHLPSSLRVLEWWGYPSQYLPSNFDPKKLSICMLPGNSLFSCELVAILKKFVNLTVLNYDFSECLTEIPDVSGVPNLEKMSFKSCDNLVTIHNSVGFLSKLKFLNAGWCEKLKNFPPLKLPSLEELRLEGCSSLEKFPEILGNMENITNLSLMYSGIKELPFSFQNLTRLRELSLDYSSGFGIQSSIAMMLETMSSMVSSPVKHLDLSHCSVSDDFLQIGLAWFANVQELHLEDNNFTILPACIKECRFLRKLYVDDCKHLREIRGIPPKLKHFSAQNCESLPSSCSSILSISMLLNQELHEWFEPENPMLIWTGERIPEWFDHRRRGPSISFWFRNEFPSIALCLAVGPTDEHQLALGFLPTVIINDNNRIEIFGNPRYITRFLRLSHVILFCLQDIRDLDEVVEPILENEWNHAKVLCTISFTSLSINFSFEKGVKVKEIGIHVLKQESNMEDIRFTDPYKRRRLDDVVTSPES